MTRCPLCLQGVPLLVEGSDLCIVCDARVYPDPPLNYQPTTHRPIVGHAA